ncbi:undecaprenyl-diphosphate phosphatase [Agaribacterium haliotis]|uniref:undecaprenyl-diphosphate phosphatase n=1 Tax=Agaribacterium haliotis TaxID=2013869 RepID=UPI000BB531EB|nr:undecaprenyl-diphosphate phosphatase [Agaribacterium haliotis]
MDIVHALVLALIQGITEFLPISSSGHLILPKEVLGWPDQGLAFDVAVHVGTLSAVVLYFHKDLAALLKGGVQSLTGNFSDPYAHLAWMLVAATVPAGLAGLLFNDFIEANLRSAAVIAATTIIFALLLAYADKKASFNKELFDIGLKAALIIGCAQALALVPGTSRSGITITAALLLGFNRESAAKFSFFMSVPIIVLSGAFKGLELLDGHDVDWAAIAVGVVVSAISAYLCIHYFLSFINRIGMMPFVWYRLALGAVLIAMMVF